MNTEQKKVVQAYIVCDDKNRPLAAAAGMGKVLTQLMFIYYEEKDARVAWRGFNIHPCTITFTV